MPQFNLLDIGFCVVLLLFVVRGGLRGMIHETTGVIGLLLGVWVARSHYSLVLPSVEKAIHTTSFAQHCIAYATVFVIVVLLVAIAGKLVRKFMTFTLTTWVDHMLGCVVGALQGILICSFAVAILLWLVPNSPFLSDSFFTLYLKAVIAYIKNFLPSVAVNA